MGKNKFILASVVSILVIGGAIFAIVNSKKSKNEETSSNSVSSDEINEETTDSDEEDLDFDFEDIEGTYEGSTKYSSAIFKTSSDFKSSLVLITYRDSKSSSSFTRWTMTVKADLGWLRENESSDVFRLSYSDCSREEIGLDDSGKEKLTQKVYSCGKGYFDVEDDYIVWNDSTFKEGDALKGCKFIKI